MPKTSVQTISLYFRQGSSDKEYHASIDAQDDGYVVHFAYGRRGSTLQTGTKTNTPVDLETANQIFGKLVSEKKAKGYTEGAAGTPYEHTEKENRVTGILPQLLNPIEESEVPTLLEDDHWCAQEKLDGKRLLLQKEGTAIHGINRKGLVVGLPSPVVLAAHAIPGDFLLDGESIGEKLHVFDVLSREGEDLCSLPYQRRAAILQTLLAAEPQRIIVPVETAWKEREKSELVSQLRDWGKEGIVFKRADALYVPGRPASGGTQLKHKFCATLSAIVGTLNPQRSIEIKLFNAQGTLVSAGNVTIPINHAIPKVGEVVEVRYLYAFRESGCVYQPVYLGVRSDLLPTECVARQLKFKSREDES